MDILRHQGRGQKLAVSLQGSMPGVACTAEQSVRTIGTVLYGMQAQAQLLMLRIIPVSCRRSVNL